MIYILYGQPGSGKTTLGKLLVTHLATTYHIDGDHFRAVFTNEDYSRKGREDNIRNANVVATYLSKTYLDPVVMSLVNPYTQLRQELCNHNFVLQILLETDRKLRRRYHCKTFEVGNPDLVINTDSPVDDTWNLLQSELDKYSRRS